MKKFTNIRDLGRFKHSVTGQEVNIKKGTNIQRGTDSMFYLYRNSKVFVSDMEFYNNFVKL